MFTGNRFIYRLAAFIVILSLAFSGFQSFAVFGIRVLMFSEIE